MKIRAIIKRPDEAVGHITNVRNELRILQDTVGGYIETVRIGPKTVMILNEEGKLAGLEPNFKIGMETIVGTVIVVGEDGDEFTDCPISLEEWKMALKEWGN